MSIYLVKLYKEQERMKKIIIIWDDSQKITQNVGKMYNIGLFNMDDMIDWEDKDNVEKTWFHWQEYYTKLYSNKKHYNKVKAKNHGFENAENVGEAWTNLDDDLRLFLEVLEEAVRDDKEHIQHMSATNETMVNLSQHQAKSILYQHKQIAKLMEQVERLTKLVEQMGG